MSTQQNEVSKPHQPGRPFDKSGLAALSDLETTEWRELFDLLENEQATFLKKEAAFRSPEYKWPKDPLHTWSRVWEYPYVYNQIIKWRKSLQSDLLPMVVDLGSGVTFFPFSVARLGCHVVCCDVDPVCETDLRRASASVSHFPGQVKFRLSTPQKLPFGDGEADVIYCISVLEHIPNPMETINEISRILKSGGLLLLTIDLDLRGDSEIGVEKHSKIIHELRQHFHYADADSSVHPADLLTSGRGPYKYDILTGTSLYRFLLKQKIKMLVGLKPSSLPTPDLAVQAFAMVRKA